MQKNVDYNLYIWHVYFCVFLQFYNSCGYAHYIQLYVFFVSVAAEFVNFFAIISFFSYNLVALTRMSLKYKGSNNLLIFKNHSLKKQIIVLITDCGNKKILEYE